jgi:hypothetical protein
MKNSDAIGARSSSADGTMSGAKELLSLTGASPIFTFAGCEDERGSAVRDHAASNTVRLVDDSAASPESSWRR